MKENYFKGDELAQTIFETKYQHKGETPDEMHRRMAKEFARADEKYCDLGTRLACQDLSELGKKHNELDEETVYNLFKGFKKVIPQGSVMSQLGTGVLGSLSNCVVVPSPVDSYGGIFLTDQQLGQLMKRRCGVGTDISELRPEGVATMNVAKSSTGAVSFMNRFSNTTREVAQGGRRGALMLSIDINHPDVEEFIKIKQDLTKVTGANISVRVNDEFMEAVQNDDFYALRWPCNSDISSIDLGDLPYRDMIDTFIDGKKIVVKKVKAKAIWEELIKAAHGSAEPGILFWDSITEGPDGVYPTMKPISTNPCGEIPIPGYDSCRLIAMNLTSYVSNPYTPGAKFNTKEFKSDVYQAMRLSDLLVDLEIENIDRIIDKISMDPESNDVKNVELNLWNELRETGRNARRTGLGITGLGDTLAMMGVGYGDNDGLKVTHTIMNSKMEAELDATTDLAILRGAFNGWDSSAEFEISSDLMGRQGISGENLFYKKLLHRFPERARKMLLYGRRNVSWSTIAPTGSLSMLAQVSSGIEPMFAWGYMRRKKINPSENTKPDFIDENGDEWTEHAVLHEQFKVWLQDTGWDVDDITKEELEEEFKASPWFNNTANDLSSEARVDMQAICQEYTTHSISSTVNLPKDVSVEKVNDIYINAWKSGLKGITVYRDGSRDGVLVTDSESDKVSFSPTASLKRPEVLDAEAFVVKSGGETFSAFVGTIAGLPYEIFAYKGGTKTGIGTIHKEGKGEYYFTGEEDGSKNRVITGKMTDEQEVITRLLSGSLRHGRAVEFIVNDLEKTSGSMFSFNAAIAKVLKRFIKGNKSTIKCQNPECTGDGTNVIYEEGCNKCLDCGSSACG